MSEKPNIEKENEIKLWNGITISIVILSLTVIIFSFLAPIIITSENTNPRFDFTNTGQIGDTIGGLMNPFVALAGVLLTFIAFYIQLQANRIQIAQFKKSMDFEKSKLEFKEKNEALFNLEYFKIDIEALIKDSEGRAERLKEFYENEKSDDYKTNLMFRTPTQIFNRFLNYNRLSIYKGFQYFLSNDDSWVKKLNRLNNIVEFLPELFKHVYELYDKHSEDIFKQLMNVRDKLLKFMDMNSSLINDYKSEFPEDYLTQPACKLCNETIGKYYDILNEDRDDNNNPIQESDLKRINAEVLLKFIDDAIKLRNANGFDRRLEVLIDFVASIRRDMELIRNRKSEFAQNIEKAYKSLIEDEGDKKSQLNELKSIVEFIETGLNEARKKYKNI